MKTVLLGSCLGLLSTGAVWADCPVAADLDKGIRFTVNAQESETIRNYGDGVLLSLYEVEGATGSHVLLGQGIYLLQLMDIEDGKLLASTRSTYAYAMRPSEMPVPTPNGGWSAQYMFEGFEAQSVEYVFGALTKQSFGECSYDMIPVDAVYQPAGDHEILHYFPELGLSYLAGYYDNGKLERYSYVGISAVE